MEAVSMEKECSALGGLFQSVLGDMKSSYPIWEDFISKAGKLQSQLRATVTAAAAFLDAFQKVADLATSSRGGSRDIGSALTRMCMRHRSIEAKLRQFSMAFTDSLINPLQEQMEEWKKGANNLDKDHAKEYKKARSEIKKKSSDTLKLQKKAKKGRGDFQPQLDNAMQDVSDKYVLLEETEKQAVRKALIEERMRFCAFVSMLRPVVDEEISMLGEVTHLQTISDDLKMLTMDPHKLPPASEQVILDLKGSDHNWSYQTPPSSPSTTMSRKSSMCSSLNSVNSTDSCSSGTSLSHSPSPHYRYRSSTLPLQTPARLSSISSHDSGFISQPDIYTYKSPSPLPQLTLPQLSNGYDRYGGYHHSDIQSLMGGASAQGACYPLLPPSLHSSSITASSSCPTRSWSQPGPTLMPAYTHYCPLGSNMVPSSKVPSWKDWAKPGPYDQPMVNTLKRRKDRESASLPADPSSGTAPAGFTRGPEDLRAPSVPHKMGELEAQEDLALFLSQGLQLEIQRSSRDSLQCSSGYSTQSTTPCCSEDTIPSQVSDYDYFSLGGDQEVDQQDFDKSSTIPRNSDITQSYRRKFQSKRPASTAGLPSTAGGVTMTPGVATIRRTPSTKPSARRGTNGPIPIRTPVIPVQIPALAGSMGGAFPGGLVLPVGPGLERQEPWEAQSPESPAPGEEGELGVLPLASWSGQATTNPPVAHLTTQQPGFQEQVCGGYLEDNQGGTMLQAIQRGIKLKRTNTNDRSAPRIV